MKHLLNTLFVTSQDAYLALERPWWSTGKSRPPDAFPSIPSAAFSPSPTPAPPPP